MADRERPSRAQKKPLQEALTGYSPAAVANPIGRAHRNSLCSFSPAREVAKMHTVSRTFAFAVLIALLGLGAAPAGARVAPEPTVDVQPVAGLAPDAHSIGVQVIASCPERWGGHRGRRHGLAAHGVGTGIVPAELHRLSADVPRHRACRRST
jgi:hypothetical protein